MDKSPDAFRTISEAADDLDVPQHVLRFWESKFHQIKPLKRGGGRRYYRPVDVDLLRGIKQLLYGDGYTIKGVQKILRENGVAHVQAVGSKSGPEAGGHPEAGEHPEKEMQQASVMENIKPAPVGGIQKSTVANPVRTMPAGAAKGLTAEHSRLLKAALFELSEIKLLLKSAPLKP